MKRLNLIIGVLVAFSTLSSGQNILTPDEAITQTIENNFGIKIATKSIEIATNNASKTAVVSSYFHSSFSPITSPCVGL